MNKEDIQIHEVKLKNGNIQFQACFEVGVCQEVSALELSHSHIDLSSKIKERLVNILWGQYRDLENKDSNDCSQCKHWFIAENTPTLVCDICKRRHKDLFEPRKGGE